MPLFKPLGYNANMKRRQTAVSLFAAAAAIIAIVMLLMSGGKEPDIAVADGVITIGGMFGTAIDISDVRAVRILERSMKEIGTGRRINGYGGFDGTLKGHFSSDELGDIILYVKSSAAPTIWIARNEGKDVYISFKDAGKTRALYTELLLAV